MTARPPAQPGVALHVRLSRLPLPVLLTIMLVAGLCALLALNTASAAQELKQRSLNDSNTALSDLEQQLMRDLAAKQAPASLAAAAAAQGLVPNPNPAFLRLNADGSVTVLGSPAAATTTPPAAPPPPQPAPPAPATSATSAAAGATPARTAPSTSTGPAPASSRPASRPAGSSSRTSAPVVTVTVTRPAAAPTPSATARTTNSTAPGGP
ncbi:MAG TPA: hypothetical protein VGB75_18540 [Jatrophihabitans sp.]|jgi:hypothetical protein|uniref:hypothetical protein n=1 Tax=Jatrophihabitans sp. TaxID=1932789 RepID=UPI002EFF3AC4